MNPIRSWWLIYLFIAAGFAYLFISKDGTSITCFATAAILTELKLLKK